MISSYRRLWSGTRRRRTLAAARAHPAGPLISVVMPTYETEARYLREAIDSVRAQDHGAWQLCIADDGSRGPQVRREIERARSREPRIEAVYLERNAGISAATNAALGLARGEFVAFLDHDDVLTEDALSTVAASLAADPELDVVYSDSDKLTLHGRRADPFFKPDWSPVYALGAMYIGHLLVVRRTLAEAVGGFDSTFDKIQDFEFLLRVSERTGRIHHIARILYHWRAIPGSIAAGALEKSGVGELQAAAVTAHLARVGCEAVAVPHPAIAHRARLVRANGDRQQAGALSVVVVWDGADRVLERLLASLGEPGVELIVVGPPGCGPVDPVADREPALEALECPRPFGRARAANLGAARARGDWLLLCDARVEAGEPDWLEQLLVHAQLPGVVAVGPLLVRPDGRAEAAGLATGLEAPAMAMLAGVDGDGDGYYGAMACARDVSAVSGRAMAVSAAAFRAAGGFSEHYATEYEDVDLCQRLRAAGGRVIYTPRPRFVDHETPAAARARADVVDRALFVDSWYDELAGGDPYYNPNFERSSGGFEFSSDYARSS